MLKNRMKKVLLVLFAVFLSLIIIATASVLIVRNNGRQKLTETEKQPELPPVVSETPSEDESPEENTQEYSVRYNCKKYKYHVKDEIANFDLLFNDDCTVTVLNSRVLNLIDDLKDIKGINYYRLAFTNESNDDVKQVIRTYKRRLSNLSDTTKLFNSNTDTRGHFNKEIM